MTVIDRSTFLGATDVAAILGCCPWRSPWKVWAEKTGRLQNGDDNGGDAAELGLAIEPVLLRWAEETLGPIQPGGEAPISGTPIICHPDGRTEDNQPVEAKTSGLEGPVYGEWGQAGTDQIPQYYLVQTHIQIYALQADVCHVPVLLAGRPRRMYHVPADRAIEEALIERACQWWQRHVIGDRPPEQTETPPLKVLQALKRQPKSVVPIDQRLVDAYEQALACKRDVAKKVKEAKRALIAALGDAEAGSVPDGRLVTYLEQSRREHVVRATTYRVLKIKKGSRL